MSTRQRPKLQKRVVVGDGEAGHQGGFRRGVVRGWTQLGYAGVIVFYLALWPFGWMETVWVLVMLAPMGLLLRAERRAALTLRAEPTPTADVGS